MRCYKCGTEMKIMRNITEIFEYGFSRTTRYWECPVCGNKRVDEVEGQL